MPATFGPVKVASMSAFASLVSKYSTVLVLLSLCIIFSLATVVDQTPNATEAARQVSVELADADWEHVLVVSTDNREDVDFADALQRFVADRIPQGLGSRRVQGTPQVVRKALEASTAPQEGSLERVPLLVVQSPSTQSWTLFDDLPSKFPGREIRLLHARSTRWPNFLKANNLINIVNQIVVIAIIAVGMTLVILIGGIDLSVGSLIALSAVVSTRAIRDWGGGAEATSTTMVLAGLLSLLLCAACGFANGVLVVGFSMPPFIATLGTMLMTSGLAFILSQGQSIDAVPEAFIWLGRGTALGLPVAVWLMLCLYAVAHFVMKHTTYGRWIYAIGGNVEAARLCGIQVKRWILSTYVLSSFLAGLGGLVMASRLKSGDAKYGNMYELYVIAAVVVGGTSLRGGYGTVFGTLVGALIIAVIENGMNLVQIESYTQKVVFGAIILVAVLVDRMKHASGSIAKG